jgi:RNA polymerase sigma factor (sigma-70 family)
MDETTDADLIRASLGEPRVFAGIFERHFARVRGYLGRRVEYDIASDLASDTFTVAFDRRGRFDPARTDAAPWLLGIATNLLRHHRRSEGRRLRALARLPREPGVEDGASAIASRIDADALRGPLFIALSDLAPGDRDVLLLLAWADLSYAEIATALEIPVGTVRSRLHRARARLRERLGANGQSMVVDTSTREVS